MTKVSASLLKAKMGKYMRLVRSGTAVLITDRGTAVARLEPVDRHLEAAVGPGVSHAREPGAPALGQLAVRAIRHRETDTLSILLEDRRR